jgi:hypothetical protein
MAVTTDYDAPRRSTLQDVDTETLDALTAAATPAARSPDVDLALGEPSLGPLRHRPGTPRPRRPDRRTPCRADPERDIDAQFAGLGQAKDLDEQVESFRKRLLGQVHDADRPTESTPMLSARLTRRRAATRLLW